jgi:exodeoxyribonuclease VIII
MIDIETMGTSNEAAIISIGAAKFDPMSDGVTDTFYVPVTLLSSVAAGLKIDAKTVMWWMHPDRAAARESLLEIGAAVDLFSALDGFATWFGPDSLPTWGNGATFDNVIMRTAFQKAGIDCPWGYTHDRCYRTLKGLAPDMTVPREGTHHNALDDAIHQATYMQRVASYLGLAL